MSWSQRIEDAAGGSFEAWFQDEIRPLVQPIVASLIEEVEGILARLSIEAEAAEALKRDRWFLFADHAQKQADSVERKLAADLEAAPPGPLGPEELRRLVLGLGDLGRFRVVCSLPRDVARVRGPLLALQGASNVKDFVRDTTLRQALRGHRAVQFVLRRGGVGVEIQIMTTLQHAWDRRNHCFYEWLREGREEDGLELRIDDHAVAEALHVVDRMADVNFATFLDLRSRR